MIAPLSAAGAALPGAYFTASHAGSDFAALLERKLKPRGKLRLSAHASDRLARRGIALAEEDIARIGGALDQAERKGARESLVVSDGVALLVSVPNRTVITAMPIHEADTNIFTNIDSAVVLAPRTTQDTQRPDPARGSLGTADRTMPRREQEVTK